MDNYGPAPETTGDRFSYGPLSTASSGVEAGPTSGRDGGGLSGSLALLGGSIALLAVGILLILASRRTLGAISTPPGN
jgi:hypothetical protein